MKAEYLSNAIAKVCNAKRSTPSDRLWISKSLPLEAYLQAMQLPSQHVATTRPSRSASTATRTLR